MVTGESGGLTKNQALVQKCWLMKTEPHVFSFDDLKKAPGRTTPWEGVRNYQARNFMRDEMRLGDQVLFYHSHCPEPGVVGLAEVSREAYPDASSWNAQSPYFDPRSSLQSPRWFMVNVTWKEDFARLVSLQEMRRMPPLQNMNLLRKGQRLSVMPVTWQEFQFICQLGRGQGHLSQG